jgi:hypothetical protein
VCWRGWQAYTGSNAFHATTEARFNDAALEAEARAARIEVARTPAEVSHD